jgi:hypothetical protein
VFDPEPTRQGVPDGLISDIFRLFINRVDVSLRWRGQWYIDRTPLTSTLIERALAEPIPLGVAAVSGTGTSRWICWDSDCDDERVALVSLYDRLPEDARLFETSRRGAHVWLFHQPVSWHVAHGYGRTLAAEVELAEIEVFPKHRGINAVRLPGMTHPRSGLRHAVIDPKAGEVVDLGSTLRSILPVALAPTKNASHPFGSEVTQPRRQTTSVLIAALAAVTLIKEYAPGRASGICPWHEDNRPSLYIKEGRFHCLACGVWGDVHDVRRWREGGIAPPRSV